MALLILIPVKQELERRTFAYQLPLPDAQAATSIKEDRVSWSMQSIKPGDTLAQLFVNEGLSSQLLYKLTQTEHGASLNQLHPGDKVGFNLDEAILANLLLAFAEGRISQFVRSEFKQKPTLHFDEQWTFIQQQLLRS